jgi:hypothetical protein
MRDAVVERPPSPQSHRARGSQLAVDKDGEDQNANVEQDVDASQLATAVRAPLQDVYVAEQERTLTTEQLWDELDRLEEAEKTGLELSNVCLVAAVTAARQLLCLHMSFCMDVSGFSLWRKRMTGYGTVFSRADDRGSVRHWR